MTFSESPLRTDSEEEEDPSVTPEPVENVDPINTFEVIKCSEDDVGGFVDLVLKEERAEPSAVLTGQGNSVEEQTSANAAETEEENKEECETEEDESVAHLSCIEESEEAQTASNV